MDSDQAAREIVLNYLLAGMTVLSVIDFFITLLDSVFMTDQAHPLRLLFNVAITLFFAALYTIARYGHKVKLVGAILTLLIISFGGLVAAQWGVLDPDAMLLLGLGIVAAGILVGARYSLYATSLIIVMLGYFQHGEASGALRPDLSWLGSKPAPGDVVAFSAILLVIALVSWLFNRQMELSLKRAQHSEKALARQRDQLESKAEKRAQQLAAAQLDQMQELYRFAELGRLSTALFHDLANHLSTVSLDIEGLSENGQPGITKRISQNIGHIDAIVRRVRQQLRGQNNPEVFDVLGEIDEVVKILKPAADQAKVSITIERDKSVKPALCFEADVVRFRQVILNLLANAIEAYPDTSDANDKTRTVTLRLERKRAVLDVKVSDRGPGVPPEHQPKIFNPFYTTKQHGTGIGLFIVKQVVEHDFGGSITMSSSPGETCFEVSLPKSYYAKP
jgi:signal transduction histidine kinase